LLGSLTALFSLFCISLCALFLSISAGVESELSQLQRIFALLGTPTVSDWPHASQLKHFVSFKPQSGHSMRALFPALPDDACELLSGLLTLNPAKRLTATEALAHRYFSSKPMPTPLAQLPSLKTVLAGKLAAEQAAAQQAQAARPAGKRLSYD
jgi:cyclin-dependent kinase 7